MKDLFANLYNKVLSFFHQTESNNGEASKNVACNRLKLVLMQDRTNLSPAIMDRMKHELIDLLSKYLELDRELLDLSLEQEDEQMALMLSIPVIRAKDEEEIQEILKQEDEAKNADNEGVNDEVNEGAESDSAEADTEVSDEDEDEDTEDVEESDSDAEQDQNDDTDETEETKES